MILADIIKIVSDFQRNSGMNIHKIPIPIDDSLIYLIGKHLKLKDIEITVTDISTSSKLISGYIQKLETEIKIGVRENLNPCWTRFVTCKELSHILMGHNGAGVTTNPKELINGLYSQILFGASDQLDHEFLAQICALEIMMPYEVSQPLFEDTVILATEIAQKFKVPLGFVQSYKEETVFKNRRMLYEALKK